MIKFLKDRILPLFMIAWLGGLLPACINDDEDTATGSEKTDGFNISIAISAGEASTARAEDGDFLEKGVGAENYIDIKDLQIYAFPVSTDPDKNNRPLAQVYPKSNDSNVAMEPSVVQIGNTYYLNAELSYDTFSKPENQRFKLVAVANGNIQVTTWQSLMDATYIVTGNTSWIPQWGTSGIPMFGIQTVSLEGYSFKVNNRFNPYPLDDVNMLRAMAKIEVVDQIADEYNARIASVSVSPYHTKGCFAPLPSEIQEETPDVKEAHIPVDPGLVPGQPLLFQHLEKENKFVAYLPEYSFAKVSRDIITLKVNDVDYTLSVSPYNNDGKPIEVGRDDYPWKALLRNHIYRYTVTGIDAFSANIILNVLDWEQGEELTWDYNDNIGITGSDRLTWTDGTYQNLNDANAHLILLQELSVAAECKFKISTPKNATWRASLVYASGEKDAFMFVDETGNEIAQPEGTIDGETVVALRIKAKRSPGQENNTARLQIAVTLPNGRTMNADVLNGKYGDNKYFTIVQNANL